MSYKNLSEEAREGLSRREMKNQEARIIKPTKNFFSWIACNFDLIIFGMIALIGFTGVICVYFDWIKYFSRF